MYAVSAVLVILVASTNAFIPQISLKHCDPHHHHRPPPPPRCNEERFSNCTVAFADDLGVDITSNYTAFIESIAEKSEEGGQSYFEQVCSAFQNYHKCFGCRREADDCNSVENLIGLNLTKEDAIGYNGIYNAWGFECGPAFRVLNSSYDCIQNASRDDKGILNWCIDRYINDTEAHPRDVCWNYERDVMACYQKVYDKACPRTGPAICEILKIEMDTSYPPCRGRLHCGRPPPPTRRPPHH